MFLKKNAYDSAAHGPALPSNLRCRCSDSSRPCICQREASTRAQALALFSLLILPASIFAQQTLIIDVSVFGLNENQTTAISQINSACDSVAGNTTAQARALLDTCDRINSLDPNNPDDAQTLAQITEALSPEESFAINDSLVALADYQTTNVRARLDALRKPALGSITNLTAQTTHTIGANSGSSMFTGATGGGASSDLTSRLGSFVSGHVSSGDINGAVLQQDADTSSSSLTVGADYRITDNVIAGLGIGLLQDESSFTRVEGGSESEGFNLTAFASWHESDKWYLDFVLDLGQADHELERSISLDASTSRLAIASPGSSSTALTLGAGRSFQIAGMELGGYFRLSHERATIDAFSESQKTPQAGLAALYAIGEQEVLSTEAVIGFELSKAINTSRAVLVPMVRVEVVSENERTKDDVVATWISTGTVARYRGEDRVGSYSNLGLGGVAVFTSGRSAYAYYETHIQHDLISQDWIKAGLRFEF